MHATVDLDLSRFMLVLQKEARRESSMCDPFCKYPAFLAKAEAFDHWLGTDLRRPFFLHTNISNHRQLRNCTITRCLCSNLLDGHPYHGQRGVSGVDEVLVERLDLPVRQPQGNILGHETHVVLVPKCIRSFSHSQLLVHNSGVGESSKLVTKHKDSYSHVGLQLL